MEKNPCLGWILRDNPHFWEEQGFRLKKNPEYYGCGRAKVNHHPVYEKVRYIHRDYEEQAAVEVFACDYGVISHSHMVFLFEWNNSGGSMYPMIAAKQVSTMDQYNEFIQEFGFTTLEDGETFLLKVE